VLKPATDTPWVTRLLGDCLRDAGIPDGVFNFVTGPGRTLGQALITCPDVDGVTFTGSFDVGMGIFRDFSQCRWIRPIILELGGKNPRLFLAMLIWNGLRLVLCVQRLAFKVRSVPPAPCTDRSASVRRSSFATGGDDRKANHWRSYEPGSLLRPGDKSKCLSRLPGFHNRIS